ncbi:TPA: hypothetical protein ACHTMH_003797 [Pseudomonas aeruginosa]
MKKSTDTKIKRDTAPPSKHYSRLNSYLSPEDDFVVSRGLDGSVVSIFKHNIWDVRMYDARNKHVYNFESWCECPTADLAVKIIREMKVAQLARLYLSGKPRKFNSIRLSYLRSLASLAFNNQVSLTELFNEPRSHTWIVSSFSMLTPSSMKPMLAVLRDLFKIRAKHTEFEIAPSSYELMANLENIYDRYPKAKFHEPLQTKLIPSRIYSTLICSLGEMLDTFNSNSHAICELYERRADDALFGVPQLKSYMNKKSVTWANALAEVGLTDFFEKSSISNWKLLSTYLGQIQAAAKYWIHLFSGMRDNEANFLPADAYTSINVGDGSFKILQGFTSKISARNHTATFWITHEIVEKGVAAAVAVGRIAALKCGWDDTNKSQFPLFVGKIARQKKSGSSNKHTWHFESAPVAGSIPDSALRPLLAIFPALCIREEDIRELEMFDGFRNWRDDATVKIGDTWPLATHQCRRSLAVYGARSGMLSLGSSALQFKQLTEAMASYYRKDSAFAVNFLQTEDCHNWMEELEHERRIAEFIQYEGNVINSTSRLWGGEGNRIQVARDKGVPLIITTDRALTERKFALGEMVYKASPIGGCTNLEHCDKISFTSIFACIDCEKAILDEDRTLRNIKRGITNLSREQALFPPENPLHQQLDLEISALYKKLDKRGLRDKLESLL